MTMYLRGMLGLGDNLYQRAVVRTLGSVYLETTWPQLYADLPNVVCGKANTLLRTQKKNAARADLRWGPPPPARARFARIGYRLEPGKSMLQSMLDSVGAGATPAVDFRGPQIAPCGPFAGLPGRPYVVVRPATVRAEWQAAARNPAPGYLARAAARARAAGLQVIAVADVAEGKEWLAEPCPPADVALLRGELRLEELLSLVARAAGVIGGVGWALPAAMAYGVPMLLIYGGWGHSNGPHHVLDPRLPTSGIIQALPDNFCMCKQADHSCNKTISNLERYIDAFIGRVKNAYVVP